MNYYLNVLKNYATFAGRARRSEYWYFALFNLIAYLALYYTGAALGIPLLGSIYYLAVIVPGIAVGVRRMHDVGKSGWYVLIPIYNLILAFTDGNVGPNEYGTDPKRPEMQDEIDMIGNN